MKIKVKEYKFLNDLSKPFCFQRDRDDELELDSSNRITSIKGFRGAGR